MTVQIRNVYYFSGFDPRGTAYYARLFRAELRKSGYDVGVSTFDSGGNSGGAPATFCRQVWAATGRNHLFSNAVPPGRARLNLFLMNWDDIIRRNWLTSPWTLLVAGWQVYRTGLANIPLKKIWRISHGAFWTGLLPLLLFVIGLTLLALVFSLAKTLFESALPAEIFQIYWLSMIFGAVVATLAANALSIAAKKIGVLWLIRIFRFNFQIATNQLSEINERQLAWMESIISTQAESPSDEVVLVGHSVGTIVMMEVARKLVADPRWQKITEGRFTKILTLGNCIPFVSLHPAAESFRETLCVLSQCNELKWWDVTAKADPLCFFRSSPLGDVVKTNSATRKPALLTARFFKMYEPSQWERMRRNKFCLHFLYLMSPEIDRDFNLYRLICDAQPLEVQINSAING